MTQPSGTSGGWRGMNGAQRRLALLLGAGFLVILAVIMVANATSMASDFAAAHVPVTTAHVWLWEVSSIIAWLTLMPPIWLLVAWLARARLVWWKTALIVAAASVPVSAWHIGVMVVIRVVAYWLEGSRYHFMMGVQNPLLYEYRKDLGTYLQFAAIALVAQWLIARAATPTGEAASARTLEVGEGAVTHHVPIDEIESVAAAGNYVEIAWAPRTLLHRATLASVETDLGDAFVRIHRGRLVRRAAIRRIETDKSGDFAVELASGAVLRGSRRYRDAL
ncbi:MAG TPA: LytTR family DNA-binding domain-containing protein [Sphingomonas sp.]|nr:LytTR family DNA-binding domain-containing protein [Sphingomonas sp.]